MLNARATVNRVPTLLVTAITLMASLLAVAAPAGAQDRLVIYVPARIIADPNFSYPVVVQLQNAAGQPAHPSARLTVTLKSSNPGTVRVYGDPRLQFSPPEGQFKGDTYVQGYVAAAARNAGGGATITASSPGFADASATIGETIAVPQGSQKWLPARSVAITLMPPVVVAGEKGPVVLYEPRDQSGRPTAEPSRANGAGLADIRLESSNPAVFPRGAQRTLSHWDYGGMSVLDSSTPVAAGQATLTVRLLDRPNIAGGSATLTVVPAAASVTPRGTTPREVVTPPQPPKPGTDPGTDPGKTAVIPSEIVLNPGEAWEGDLPVSRILDLQARLNYRIVAGANYALNIWVNGRPLTGPLLNKAAQFTYKDGRTFPYRNAEGWLVMYSPDFSANNGPAGGGYQVMTDPGEAYRYRWDLSAVAGGGPTMHVRIVHSAPKAVGPLVIRFAR
jgi:hypothetical protein